MDFTVLNRGERLAGISGVLLILIMLIFDWFGLKFTSGIGAVGIAVEGGRNAWGSYGFTDIVLFVTGVAAIALAVTAASDAEVGLPVALSAIVTALGILSLILIIISIISPPDFGVNISGSGIEHERKIGVWLGLIATAALTVGAYLAMQEEGTSFTGEVDRVRGGPGTGTGGPGASPPPPPPPSSGGPPGSGP